MVEVAVQEGTYCERVSVSGVTAVSWNNIYVLDIFSPTLLSAAWPDKKSRFPFSRIPACSLLRAEMWGQNCPSLLWAEGACLFLTAFWSVTTVDCPSCYKMEGTTLSKGKLISSTWCQIYKCLSSEFNAVTLILRAPDLNLGFPMLKMWLWHQKGLLGNEMFPSCFWFFFPKTLRSSNNKKRKSRCPIWIVFSLRERRCIPCAYPYIAVSVLIRQCQD